MQNVINRFITAVKFLLDHLYRPGRHTYYPRQDRKTYVQICVDNFKWMIKHREINHYYYMYGLDVKNGNNPDWYLGKKEFNKIRNLANSPVHIGDQSASYVCLLRDKFLFFHYLTALGFPTPEVIGLCSPQKVTWLDTKKVEPLNALVNRQLDVFVKDLLGECAKGVFSLKTDNGVLLVDGIKKDIQQFRMQLSAINIIQKRIRQHSKMSTLYPKSVNTIRLLSIHHPDGIQPLAAILRMGANGVCDNLTAGGVAAGINMETGKLTRYGVMRPDFGRMTDRHPVSGTIFENFEVPFFREAVETISRLHKFFYGIKCIGWDIAITENGPVIIEGNDNWEVPTFQFFDPHFKQKLMVILQ